MHAFLSYACEQAYNKVLFFVISRDPGSMWPYMVRYQPSHLNQSPRSCPIETVSPPSHPTLTGQAETEVAGSRPWPPAGLSSVCSKWICTYSCMYSSCWTDRLGSDRVILKHILSKLYQKQASRSTSESSYKAWNSYMELWSGLCHFLSVLHNVLLDHDGLLCFLPFAVHLDLGHLLNT